MSRRDQVVMPKLSEAMESGKIIKWLKKEGDRVQGGDILAEVETDKADVEMEAFGAGVLRKILVPAGTRRRSVSLIGVIAEPERRHRRAASSRRRGTRGRAGPRAPRLPVRRARRAPSRRRQRRARRRVRPASRRLPRLGARGCGPPRPAADRRASGRVKASPLARKIAAQCGRRSRHGPRERARRAHHSPRRRGAPPRVPHRVRAARPPRPRAARGRFEDRAALAHARHHRQAHAAGQGAGTALLRDGRGRDGPGVELREELNALEGQPKISVNDLVLRACALAPHAASRRSMPRFQGDAIRVYRRAHIGIAVALEDGLITPVLRDCQAKSLAQIAVESRDLAERARGASSARRSCSGATFSDLEPRHVRRRRVLGDHQSARGRHPGRRLGPPRARSWTRRARRRAGG